MVLIKQTPEFARWFSSLRDLSARARIQVRIDRLELGLAGDWRPVGKGVLELRVHYGPGYRVYFVQRDGCVIILLAGGDKRTQTEDIRRATALADNV